MGNDIIISPIPTLPTPTPSNPIFHHYGINRDAIRQREGPRYSVISVENFQNIALVEVELGNNS